MQMTTNEKVATAELRVASLEKEVALVAGLAVARARGGCSGEPGNLAGPEPEELRDAVAAALGHEFHTSDGLHSREQGNIACVCVCACILSS